MYRYCIEPFVGRLSGGISFDIFFSHIFSSCFLYALVRSFLYFLYLFWLLKRWPTCNTCI